MWKIIDAISVLLDGAFQVVLMVRDTAAMEGT